MKENYTFIMEEMIGSYCRKKYDLENQGWKRVTTFRQKGKDGRIFGCAIYEWPEEKEQSYERR